MADAAPVVSSANRLSITAQTVRVMAPQGASPVALRAPSTHPASTPFHLLQYPQDHLPVISSRAYAFATPPSTWRRQI